MRSNVEMISRKVTAVALSAMLGIGLLGTAPVSQAAKAKIKKVAVTNVNKNKLDLQKGEKFTLKTKVTGTGKKTVTYKSSKKAVVTVTKKGVLTAKKAGKANITVTSKANKKKKAKIKVTVYKAVKQSKDLSYDGYTSVWKDDFNGTKLNRDDWNVETHEAGWVNNELQKYVDSEKNIYVKDGKLHLNMIKSKDKKGNVVYTSGRVNTMGKQDFKYGLFEAVAKVPSTAGYWPAFWLLSDESLYGQWPKCGEIDVMEIIGSTTKHTQGNIHFGKPYSNTPGGYDLKSGRDFANAYHKFSCEWEPDHITFFVDGIKIHEVTDWWSGDDDGSQLTFPAPFDQPFHIILNLAFGGDMGGSPNKNTLYKNNEYLIDSVQVWQKDDAYYEDLEANVKQPERKKATFREPDADGNYILNANFASAVDEDADNGTNWYFYKEADGEGAKVKVADNAVTITPKAAGAQNHSVQLRQHNVPIYKDVEYTLTFDAQSTENRTMIVDVSAPTDNYSRYLNDTTVDLTKEKKTYTLTFKSSKKKNDPEGSLEFNLGNQGSTAPVTISNVSLKITSGTITPDTETREPRGDGNYIWNGAFQEGEGRLAYWDVAEKDKSRVFVTNVDNIRMLEVRCGDDTTEANPIVVSQKNVPIKPGKYELSFEARKSNATAADTITMSIAGQKITKTLTGDTAEYSEIINITDATDNTFRMEFPSSGIYNVDNVRLVEAALIKNGSFTNEMSGWNVYQYSNDLATYIVDSQHGNDSALEMTINNTSDTDWHIQVQQENVQLVKDKWYKLSLKAKSTIDRDILVTLQHNGGIAGDDIWTAYSGDDAARTMSLKKTTRDGAFQYYECIFQMTEPTDLKTELSITLGAVGGKQIKTPHYVYIDDVKLEESDTKPEAGQATKNMLVNADFSDKDDPRTGWGINGEGEKATVTIEDGVIKYAIKNTGENDWDVQLTQAGLNLKDGKTYHVSYDITSTKDRLINTGLQGGEDVGYAWYGGIGDQAVKAGKVTTVEFDVTMTADNPKSVLFISMGKNSGETASIASDIMISNLVVEEK